MKRIKTWLLTLLTAATAVFGANAKTYTYGVTISSPTTGKIPCASASRRGGDGTGVRPYCRGLRDRSGPRIRYSREAIGRSLLRSLAVRGPRRIVRQPICFLCLFYHFQDVRCFGTMP